MERHTVGMTLMATLPYPDSIVALSRREHSIKEIYRCGSSCLRWGSSRSPACLALRSFASEFKETTMETLLNICVIAATVFAFGYLGFVILWPERF